MSTIDRQRIAAVRIVEALGYTWCAEHGWRPTQAASRAPMVAEADMMHGLLMERAERLIGSADLDELAAIGEVLDAYEAVRWPDGKVPGGKG